MNTKKKDPAVIVTVHRPELSPQERAKRMEEIKKAATALIAAQMRIHRKVTV